VEQEIPLLFHHLKEIMGATAFLVLLLLMAHLIMVLVVGAVHQPLGQTGQELLVVTVAMEHHQLLVVLL
jgi:hypothetical protein